MKGSYILVLFLKSPLDIEVGKLGNLFFKKGYYFYVGSALGERGSSTLENRVSRHLRLPEKKRKHWHVDYLLDNFASIERIFLIPTIKNLECLIAQALIDCSGVYVEKFGSSDCNCKSHLIYFESLKECSLTKS